MSSAFVLMARPLVGADAAFDAVFGAFVVAVVVLSVVTLRWAVRRDRTGRAQWLLRQREEMGPGGSGTAPAPNGRRPPGGAAGEPEVPG